MDWVSKLYVPYDKVNFVEVNFGIISALVNACCIHVVPSVHSIIFLKKQFPYIQYRKQPHLFSVHNMLLVPCGGLALLDLLN